MKCKVMLWKHTTLKDGTHPIKIKVTKTIEGRTFERYHPIIGAYCTMSQWDDKSKRVHASHPNAPIKDLLGHDKISTTAIYMKSFYEEETDEAMNSMFK